MSLLPRAIPPAYSPVSVQSIGQGLLALAGVSRIERVRELILATYGGTTVWLVDSGTAALRLALEAAVGTRPGRVALPAYGCYDLLSAAHGAGVDIVFYDVEVATLAPDMASLREALDSGARTIVLAYLFGVPIEIDGCVSLARERGAWLIEDAAQGQGGRLRGRPLGSFGDASVLSFARGKGRTGGGGGCLIGRSPEFVTGLARGSEPTAGGRGARNVARALAQWTFARPSLYGIPRALPFVTVGETVYREPREPRRMGAATANILAANWDASEMEAVTRRAHAEWFARRLAGAPGFELVRLPPGSQGGYLRFPVLADRAEPDLARLGVLPGYPRALPDLRPRESDRVAGAVAGARALAHRLQTLPTHGLLGERDLETIGRRLRGDG